MSEAQEYEKRLWCPRCKQAEPMDNRRCAFISDGQRFSADNYQCMTLGYLNGLALDLGDKAGLVRFHEDEQIIVVPYDEADDVHDVAMDCTGILVMTRYKQRGRVQNVTCIPLGPSPAFNARLSDVERAIKYIEDGERQRAEEAKL